MPPLTTPVPSSTPSAQPPRRALSAWDILALLAGVLLAVGGTALGLGIRVLMAVASQGRAGRELGPESARQLGLVSYTLIALALLLGLPLVVDGLRRAFGRTPQLFSLGAWWIYLAAWPLVLGAGQAVMSAATAPVIVQALFHFGALTLPVLALMAWLARRLAARGVTWRGAWVHVVSGATVAAFLAMVLELVAGAALAAAIFIPAMLFDPGTVNRLRAMFEAWGNGQLSQPEQLQQYLSWPPLVILLLVLLSLAVPLIEEAAKPISVLARMRLRPGTVDPGLAFLFGALAGIGFTLLEGPLNTVSSDGTAWWMAAVLRAGATLLHSFNAALVAWGWAQLFNTRHWGAWLGAVGTALFLHATWNGVTILLVPADPGAAVTSAIELLCFGSMSLLAMGGIWVGARQARARAPSETAI